MTVRAPLIAAILCATVAFSAHAQGATWTLSSQPVVRLGIGEADGDMLVAPSGATRLPSGNFAVGDVDEFAIKEYSKTGTFVRKYGRKGQGPGEITYIFPLMRCGDSLVANELQSGKQSVFDHTGKFIRASRIKAAIYRIGCNTNMQFAVMGWETKGIKKSGQYRPLNPFYIARADSSAPLLLGEFPGAERFDNWAYPLGRDPRMAVGPTGAYIALADSFHILVFDLAGKPMPSFSARVPRVAATQADLTAEMEREVAMMGEKMRPAIVTKYATITPPKFLPATRELVVDADGNLWVQHYPRATLTTVAWTTFSPTGKVLANTQLPTELEVYEIGRDYVLGRLVNPDDGVSEVRMYSLKR